MHRHLDAQGLQFGVYLSVQMEGVLLRGVAWPARHNFPQSQVFSCCGRLVHHPAASLLNTVTISNSSSSAVQQCIAHGMPPLPLKDDAWLFWITTSITSPAHDLADRLQGCL